ncbi:hypothetical protein [Ileibacterium valens]|nr:hypothetical protein [Ileibacterium valens]
MRIFKGIEAELQGSKVEESRHYGESRSPAPKKNSCEAGLERVQ